MSSSQDISKAKEVNKLPNKVFTGDKVILTDSDFDGVLKLGDKDLKAGINFRIVGYEKNDKKGTAKVTIVGIDSDGSILAGSKTLNFKITEKKGSWKSGGTKLIDGKWTN